MRPVAGRPGMRARDDKGGTMALTEEQRGRVRAALAPVLPRLREAAPPERTKLLRDALERAGVTVTWDEWAALEPEFLGADAPGEGARG